jgi:hypothetical protein
VRFRDLSVHVDHVGDAAGVFVFRRVGGAVGDADLAVGVAEEGEGEVVLLRECGVVIDGVEADAEDARVLLRVFIGEVPEPGTFCRSTSGVGLRIEPEDELLPAKVAQLHAIAVVIEHLEIRRRIAYLQHLRTSEQVLCNKAYATGQRHGAYPFIHSNTW